MGATGAAMALVTAAAVAAGSGAAVPAARVAHAGAGSLGKTIKVGLDIGLSGIFAPFDSLVLQGATIAADEVNKAGGIDGKTKIKLVAEDNKGDAANVITVAQNLISSGAKVIVPGCNLDFQVATASYVQSKYPTIPVVSPCNADPTVSVHYPVYDPVGVGGNRQVAAVASYLKSRKLTRLYILNSTSNGYVKVITRYLKAAAPLYHLKVVGEGNYTVGQTDFSPQITTLEHASPKPDVVVTGMFAPDIGVFVKQLRAAGDTIPVMGTDGTDTPVTLSSAGSAANGLTFTTFAFPKPGSGTAQLYREYKAKYGHVPDSAYVALGFNAIKVMAAGLGKAHSSLAGRYRAALRSGIKVPSPTGAISYPKTGPLNPFVSVALVTVKNGKFQLVRTLNPKLVPSP